MDAFERTLRRAVRHQKAAGAIGVIVREGATRFVTFGVRDRGTETPIDPDTRFAIASVSKAFTATACAAAVDDGKLSWDDPVRRHLPAFRLADPAADSHVTVRDLLCHRTGLPRHDALWYRSPWDRAEILRRMAHLTPTASFRGAFQYNNLCFLAAGEVVAAAVGEPFEAYLKRRVLVPLGLADVTFTAAEAAAWPNRATPHLRTKGRTEPSDWLDFSNVGPAGAMNVTARELGAWIRFHLAGGLTESGERPISEANLRETYEPQTIVPFDDTTRALFPERVTQTYALGWGRADWRGELVLSHTGAIDGFRSALALLPRRNAGYAVLVNTSGSTADMVRCAWNDLMVDAPERDWTQIIGDNLAAEKARAAQAKRDRAKSRRRHVRPSAPLDAYQGVYHNPGYGDAAIEIEDGALQLSWSAFTAPLKHWQGDQFVTDIYQLGFTEQTVVFRLDNNMRPAELTLMDQTFIRRADVV